MLDRSEVGKRGYLDRDFRLVHLKDSLAQKIDYHYHEFDKLVIFLGGKVTYVVEGVTYFLKPWDIVLIQHNLIHRPIIHAEEPYERAVLWLGRGLEPVHQVVPAHVKTGRQRVHGEVSLQIGGDIVEDLLHFGVQMVAVCLCRSGIGPEEVPVHVDQQLLAQGVRHPAGAELLGPQGFF